MAQAAVLSEGLIQDAGLGDRLAQTERDATLGGELAADLGHAHAELAATFTVCALGERFDRAEVGDEAFPHSLFVEVQRLDRPRREAQVGQHITFHTTMVTPRPGWGQPAEANSMLISPREGFGENY
ncbi:hypothetical protein ACH4GK_33825 [Streptomyces rimosus]|uniref:hypothetical protein n=1 Tax=Streptomyces rimosus TaxID=1927 RepID=UPI0004CC34DB|nr:hypothetical protein [Streptomyces rimosus]